MHLLHCIWALPSMLLPTIDILPCCFRLWFIVMLLVICNKPLMPSGVVFHLCLCYAHPKPHMFILFPYALWSSKYHGDQYVLRACPITLYFPMATYILSMYALWVFPACAYARGCPNPSFFIEHLPSAHAPICPVGIPNWGLCSCLPDVTYMSRGHA